MSGPVLTERAVCQRTRPVVAIVLAGMLLALTLVTAGAMGGLRINMTPSEPLGIWRVVALDRAATVGDIVFICPPANAAMRQARQRGYLRSGLCPDGFAPLIKAVIATEGQSVEIGSAVRVDGVVLTNSAVSKRDGKGRPLAAFRGGIVPAGSVFLHSGFVGSYDSRYFGPLPVSGVLGLAQEVLTYAP